MALISSDQSPWRIFISSTYEDMIPYREAAVNALTSIEHLPIGMEHFVSSTERPLDVCLTEVRRCQLYIVLVGMKYGSIDKESGRSYTELEYEEAVKNKIPVLAFVIDENECPILPKFVDVGEDAERLKAFKAKLDQRMTSRFKSAEDLKRLAVRAVELQVKKLTEVKGTEQQGNKDEINYTNGAKLFKRFLLLPERYKGQEVVLRIRMDGEFSTWKRKEEFFSSFNVKPGDTILGNDASVIGVDMEDIDESEQSIDYYAEGKNADWILNNGVTTGTIFEGKFRLAYETVKGISQRNGESDFKIAALILLEGSSIIAQADYV